MQIVIFCFEKKIDGVSYAVKFQWEKKYRDLLIIMLIRIFSLVIKNMERSCLLLHSQSSFFSYWAQPRKKLNSFNKKHVRYATLTTHMLDTNILGNWNKRRKLVCSCVSFPIMENWIIEMQEESLSYQMRKILIICSQFWQSWSMAMINALIIHTGVFLSFPFHKETFNLHCFFWNKHFSTLRIVRFHFTNICWILCTLISTQYYVHTFIIFRALLYTREHALIKPDRERT